MGRPSGFADRVVKWLWNGEVLLRLLTACLVVFLILPTQISCASPDVLHTEIYFDGEEIDGLFGLNLKTFRESDDLGAVEEDICVKGKILVHSNSEMLNGYMDDNSLFQVSLSTSVISEKLPIEDVSFNMYDCQLDTIELLVNNATGEADFAVYSFTCQGVSGELPMSGGTITPQSLSEWELDSAGLSNLTLIAVSDGAEVIEMTLNETSSEDATAYELSSHGYSAAAYTYVLERARED